MFVPAAASRRAESCESRVIVRPMTHASLKVFDTLPAKERWFCRARLELAPLEQVAAQASGTKLLDVGCGHGVLAALLLDGHPERRVVGIDPDARKIGWANASVGKNANAEFRACTIETLAAERPAAFDCVIVADVLCLIARDTWALVSRRGAATAASRRPSRVEGRRERRLVARHQSAVAGTAHGARAAPHGLDGRHRLRDPRGARGLRHARWASSSTTSRATRAATRRRTCC